MRGKGQLLPLLHPTLVMKLLGTLFSALTAAVFIGQEETWMKKRNHKEMHRMPGNKDSPQVTGSDGMAQAVTLGEGDLVTNELLLKCK